MGFFDKKRNMIENLEEFSTIQEDIDFSGINSEPRMNKIALGIDQGLNTTEIRKRMNQNQFKGNDIKNLQTTDILNLINLINLGMKKLPEKKAVKIAKSDSYKTFVGLLTKYM